LPTGTDSLEHVRILVSELLLSLVLVHAVVWLVLARTVPAPIASPRLFTFVVACQCVALASYIVSDLWWQSTPFDTIRGWLRMIFLLFDMGAFSLLFGFAKKICGLRANGFDVGCAPQTPHRSPRQAFGGNSREACLRQARA
jgi:hypothetical protein